MKTIGRGKTPEKTVPGPAGMKRKTFIFFQKEPPGNTLHRGRGSDIIINVSQSKRPQKMPGGSPACILAPGTAALRIEESEMANYREFYEETRRRKRKAAQRRFVAAIVVLGVVLAAALLLVRCGKKDAPAPAATEKPQSMATPAPLTAQTGREDDGSWNTREPVEQTIDGEIRSADYRMLALPANGTADPSYLNGVTFLGDSLTQGFQTYAGLEAKDRSYFCAYKGMGVKQVVDDATVKNLAGEEQVPMQALIDSQPDNVYVELGVNTLNNTTDESFIAYYDRMLERLTSELPDGVGIYVQALPPIREEKRLPNQMSLTNERFRQVNDQLAVLAAKWGVYFLDIQEALVDEEGQMRTEYLGNYDCVHMSPEGYRVWENYILTHTVYNRRNTYENGSSYYIES